MKALWGICLPVSSLGISNPSHPLHPPLLQKSILNTQELLYHGLSISSSIPISFFQIQMLIKVSCHKSGLSFFVLFQSLFEASY